MIKTIAFYLPQYHSIPENDKWWGEGFTEWTNVKKSRPLFKGHIQPEVPLNNNYYNLMNSDTMVVQSELAQKYGVYGFCYYHYWFEGKLLLEKPLENMLKNDKITIPYCFCWANETWSRSWDGLNHHILIKQNYDTSEEGFTKHFEYVLKFFKDNRYIKVDNKPMFLIYKPYLITNIDVMLKVWNRLAQENGFDGIYFGFQFPESFHHQDIIDKFDFGVEFEPSYSASVFSESSRLNKIKMCLTDINTIKHYFMKKIVRPGVITFNYDMIWKMMVSRKPVSDKIFPGAFTGWDNSPRRGKDAYVFYKSTPEKFLKYFMKQVSRTRNVYGKEYIFINAWNEWGEGAHLEPDEVNGYGYLEAVKESLHEE